jgi:hypothetical protein
MSAIRQFLKRVRATGKRRGRPVKTTAMGRERVFDAFDVGEDTYIVERGVASKLSERPSVLLTEKKDLGLKGRGRVMTLTTGNHSVAAFPLLDGRFWKLSRLHPSRRSETLSRAIICANVVNDTIEISQRDVPTAKVVLLDRWLMSEAGFAMDDVVMCERNDSTLDHYRQLGQEWRVKPLAWTEAEMKSALSASRKRISTRLNYYHSAKGVHFLSFSEFRRFCSLTRTEPCEFVKALRELVSVYEGNNCSFVRLPKCRGHHEIEFFGLRRGIALERLVPPLERLLGEITEGRIGHLGVIQQAEELVQVYESLLSKSEFADETAKEFVEALYMHITGEIYSVVSEGLTPAFDDRRTALPGATFVDGRAEFHPGIDERTEILLSNIRAMLSKDEIIEYVNVYELRTDDDNLRLGRGKTREIVYKTNRGPLEHSLVEKRLSRASRGYSSYMLARVEAFKALGVNLSEYRILRRRTRGGKVLLDYYIRRRCEGEPIDAIPANYYCNADDSSQEEKETVLSMAALMGDAAAQNMAMKKFDPESASPLYGIGKEIYEFEYNIAAQRITPKSVSTCSVRGSFGWPDLSYEDDNLQSIADFYLPHYARTLCDFIAKHNVSAQEAAGRFMDGFEFRTRAMEWQLSVMRDKFESFLPKLPSQFDFDRKWRFILWSLERQERRLPILRKMFLRHMEALEGER